MKGCASKIMVFYPQHVSGAASNQSYSVDAVTSVVDIVGPRSLSVSLSLAGLTHLRTSDRVQCLIFTSLALSVCLSDFFLPLFISSLSHYRVNRFVLYSNPHSFSLPSCLIPITTQNGYGLLLGSHLHISLSYIFQKVVMWF